MSSQNLLNQLKQASSLIHGVLGNSKVTLSRQSRTSLSTAVDNVDSVAQELDRETPAGIVRLSVYINKETAEALKDFGERHDIGITEVIRRSAALVRFIDDGWAAGEKLRLVRPDGGYDEVEML